MKHTITNSLAVLLLLAIGAVGCSKEETPPDNSDTTRTPITIRVTDGGYEASDPSTAQTRAVENGYATTFTTGDQIGLYVVKPDGTVASNNIPLTHNGTGWTGDAYWGGTGAKYFAYYPYQSALTADVDPSATDAAGFFANVVLAWTPATDQSTHALYTASDLMIGEGTLGDKSNGVYPLTFIMNHAMALVVIETPTTKYTFNNDSPAIPDYYLPAPGTQFYGFMPYSPTGGTYRYLVKPAQSGATDLYGSYTAASGNTKEYIIKQNNIAPASYALYEVDGAPVTEKTHTLQVGDFYLKDGSLVAKDATLTDAQAAACIGIVLKVGRDGEGSDWNDDCDYMLKGTTIQMSTIHGYVLALDDANNGKYCQWGSDGTIVGTNTERIGFYGYTNTNTIKEFATNGNDLQAAFPPTYYATEGYEKTNPAPDNTSGWFLPSAGQCHFWLDNKDVLQGSAQKVTGNDGYNWKKFYWSSSEDGSSPADTALCLSFNHSDVYGVSKYNGYYVRSVLAF